MYLDAAAAAVAPLEDKMNAQLNAQTAARICRRSFHIARFVAAT